MAGSGVVELVLRRGCSSAAGTCCSAILCLGTRSLEPSIPAVLLSRRKFVSHSRGFPAHATRKEGQTNSSGMQALSLRPGDSPRSLTQSQIHARVKSSASASSTTTSSSSCPITKELSVGFLGLGIMGTAMARNLLRDGYRITTWNRSPDKSRVLEGEGAQVAGSPAEVTESSDITIAMLADPQAAVDVACGRGQAVAGLGPGKGYIDASTVDAQSVHTIAAAVRARGAQYLEAPVSGSKKPAEDGTLIFLAAGDRELYDRASGILDLLGKYKVFLGPEGNGANMKLVVNMVMGSMMAAFSEGLVLGERAGLDPKDILDVISQGAISSPMFSLKGPSMVAGTFPPAFPLKHQQKDLRLAIALGDELAQALPVASTANELYKTARAEGYGDNDFSAVIQACKH